MNKAQLLPQESSSLMGKKTSKQTLIHYTCKCHVRTNTERALRKASLVLLKDKREGDKSGSRQALQGEGAACAKALS